MIYRVIGLMSGSSLDGLDIVFVELEENRNKWKFEILAADCYEYNKNWIEKLANAKKLDAYNFLLLDVSYGKYIAECVNKFINEHNLHHQVQLICSHGHTVFHAPQSNMTSQIGDGATIAALTEINVVSDLRNMDVALNGQGAPIVPVGERLLFPEFDFYINVGGIANISFQHENTFVAFDVCPANKILNMLTQTINLNFDENGKLAEKGKINDVLLQQLNALKYYQLPFPKSLDNSFGADIIFPLIYSFQLNINDALRTYVEHIALQILNAVISILNVSFIKTKKSSYKLLITGGGAFNTFLINILKEKLSLQNIEIVIPASTIIQYKEALIMALLGVLRWREESTVLATVTGAKRNSIGGAVWIGQQA